MSADLVTPIWHDPRMDIAIPILALLVSAGAGVWVVRGVLRLAPSPPSLQARAASVLRGGLLIGVLERLAVTGTILLGHPEGMAVVIAIKGLGRYPELRGAAGSDPGAAEVGAAVSERFIIGTLSSLVWSAACAAGALWALR